MVTGETKEKFPGLQENIVEGGHPGAGVEMDAVTDQMKEVLEKPSCLFLPIPNVAHGNYQGFGNMMLNIAICFMKNLYQMYWIFSF